MTAPNATPGDDGRMTVDEVDAEPQYGVWQPIETFPRDRMQPVLARFSTQTLAEEDNKYLAHCAVIRFQTEWEARDDVMVSLAGPFGRVFDLSQFDAWMPLPALPARQALGDAS